MSNYFHPRILYKNLKMEIIEVALACFAKSIKNTVIKNYINNVNGNANVYNKILAEKHAVSILHKLI